MNGDEQNVHANADAADAADTSEVMTAAAPRHALEVPLLLPPRPRARLERPYIRLPLTPRHRGRGSATGTSAAPALLLLLPPLLEQKGVTARAWTEFCSRMKPLVAQMDQHDNGFYLALALLVWALGTCLAVVDADDAGVSLVTVVRVANNSVSVDVDRRRLDVVGFEQGPWWTSTVAVVLLSLMFLFLICMVHSHMRHSILCKIRRACQESEEASALYARGFNMECELLVNEGSGSRLHLYIMSADKPYDRFEVCNGQVETMMACCFRPFSTSYRKFESSGGSAVVPVEFGTFISLEDWQLFWSQIRLLSEQLAAFHTRVWPLVAVWLLCSILVLDWLLGDSMGKSVVFAVFGILIPGLVCMVYMVYRYYDYLAAKRILVYEWNLRLAGVYLEHRRVMAFDPWRGLAERHYVYIFRSSADDTADAMLGA